MGVVYLYPVAIKNPKGSAPTFYERRLEMKFANIEVFKNENGTLSIVDNNDVYCIDDTGIVVMPIEMIPTLIKCLQKIYDDNQGCSEIIEKE